MSTKMIETLEYCLEHGSMGGHDCWLRDEHGKCARDTCPNRGCNTGCVVTPIREAIATLKKHNDLFEWMARRLSSQLCNDELTINCLKCWMEENGY